MTFVAVIHIILAVLLVILVLVQDSKSGFGAGFGGGSSSQSILGPTGAPTLFAKLTRWIVIGFAATSIILTNLTARKGTSALDTMPVTDSSATAPANPAATVPANPAATEPAVPAQESAPKAQ